MQPILLHHLLPEKPMRDKDREKQRLSFRDRDRDTHYSHISFEKKVTFSGTAL